MSSVLGENINSSKMLTLMGDNSQSVSNEHFTETFGDYSESAFFPYLEDTIKSPPISSIQTSFNFTGEASNASLNWSNNYQFLNNTRLRMKYPTITVLPDYINSVRIRAPHCLGLDNIRSISLSIDEFYFSPVNATGWLFALQFCRPNTDTIDDVRRGLGCIPRLEKWSTHLHEFTSRIRLPFEIGGSIQPIKLFGAQEVKIELSYESDISKIYLMEHLVENVWTPIDFDFRYVMCIEKEIKLPKLETTVLVPSKHLKTVIPREWEAQRIYYTSEIQVLEIPNDHKINKTLTYQVTTQNKILSIGAVAQGKSDKLRDKLNFTTQANTYEGYQVIENMSFIVDSKKLIENSTESLNLHCQDMEFSCPFEKGFTMMTFGTSPRATESGIRISNSIVQISMLLTDGEITENGITDNEHEPFPRYKVMLIYRIMRKYRITNTGGVFKHQSVD